MNIKLDKQIVSEKNLNFKKKLCQSVLPIDQKKKIIIDLIKNNQVVIITGDTGSGKTTQIPRFCLEIGRGVNGIIGHTQPRRLATCSVAEYLAKKLNCKLGTNVGYKIRFDDKTSENTQIKLMTDGILLSELKKDKLLLKYDTIIIDEAHERSLNIDFILGYLRQILLKRHDLKVIITSATIDPESFSHHFFNAPIIDVSNRVYHIETRYRAIINNKTKKLFNQVNAIINAINELTIEDSGNILVFMSGEREIFVAFNMLSKLQLYNTEILPLFSSLSNYEQNKIFLQNFKRKIILSTNIAETSITIPGIKHVIDTGYARINRYISRTKINKLEIETISQASANQRKGRCGRLSNGICIRLYSEKDFFSRSKFTDPEYLRTNLASVILQIIYIGFNDITKFPFIEAPDKKAIQDGIKHLEELNAIKSKQNINNGYQLTSIGEALVEFPIEPRFARIIIEAKKYNALHEIIIIVSALSIKDPRESILYKQKISYEKHRRFHDKKSDFLSFLNLWNFLKENQDNLSNIEFKELCKKNFLNYLLICEWQNLYLKLKQIIEEQGIKVNNIQASYHDIHISLLVGFLSCIAKKNINKFEFIGIRNIRFIIFPGSVLSKKSPKWIVVSEIFKTSRLWGKFAALIQPEWIEPLAKHLIKKSYSNPHWSKLKKTVVALEKVSLYGLDIIESRLVDYSNIEPILCRELFIKHALIYAEFDFDYVFLKKNLELISEVKELENKLRSKNILISDKDLFNFYDQNIPKNIISLFDFDQWWKIISEKNPDLLNFKKNMLIKKGIINLSTINYPNYWQQENLIFKITYKFKPGDICDGISVHIPLIILNQVKNIGFDWLVPCLRYELIVTLIKLLPKYARCHFSQVSKYASVFIEKYSSIEGKVLDKLEFEFYQMTGIKINRKNWRLDKLPMHLKITFCIIDCENKKIIEGKDLTILKDSLKEKFKEIIFKTIKCNFIKTGLSTWNFGDLQKCYEEKYNDLLIKIYPALIDEKFSVGICIFCTEFEQKQSMLKGIRRLLLLSIPILVKKIHKKPLYKYKLEMYNNYYDSTSELINDCILCGINELIEKFGGLVWTEKEFKKLQKYVIEELDEIVLNINFNVEKILMIAFVINKELKKCIDVSMIYALSDLKTQISYLLFKGFIAKHGSKRLFDIIRYLNGIKIRLEKLFLNLNNDKIQLDKILQVQNMWQKLIDGCKESQELFFDLQEIRWMIEEFRISIFAQKLGTKYSISDKRIMKTIKKINCK
ncbi:ATP-dependent RNA helicase HrpA [Candidatus Providencia siddallii]|uniref:ATP-dependent RNA helicase HrpA, partial n=1 Tax=Candidatus Providencia siddallii TaxID=1715285 RepID=A0A0M6W758_9GAMM|nr:ATP-dependent RNA helicase HrpA [Candidatus Providencia siddallii]